MANAFFFREASTWHSDAFRQWDSSWQTLVSRCTRHASRRTDGPRSTDDHRDVCAQVKSTATEIERKIFHLCGLLVRLHRPMRWHVQDDLLISFDYDIFHVDLRCFTRQTYPRTPRFDRYLWPISSYWPTEFRGAASWDVSIFLKLWSFAIICNHLISFDHDSKFDSNGWSTVICSICYLLKNQFCKSFQLSCPRFFNRSLIRLNRRLVRHGLLADHGGGSLWQPWSAKNDFEVLDPQEIHRSFALFRFLGFSLSSHHQPSTNVFPNVLSTCLLFLCFRLWLPSGARSLRPRSLALEVHPPWKGSGPTLWRKCGTSEVVFQTVATQNVGNRVHKKFKKSIDVNGKNGVPWNCKWNIGEDLGFWRN